MAPPLDIFWYCKDPVQRAGPPLMMSYSTLVEIEQCPRRWSLRNSQYDFPEWHKGYPPKPSIAAAIGSIIHSTVENTVDFMQSRGISSSRDPGFVMMLRELGGWGKCVKDEVNRWLDKNASNPRFHRSKQRFVNEIETSKNQIQTKVKEIVNRLEIVGGYKPPKRSEVKEVKISSRPERKPLVNGSHAEKELISKSRKWKGYVDLIDVRSAGCKIIDFKTGDRKKEHRHQLHVYDLLWEEDSELNPDGKTVETMMLSYPDGSEEISPLEGTDRSDFSEALSLRTETAITHVSETSPVARTNYENCRFCDVRHLCSEYWQQAEHFDAENQCLSESQKTFSDVEVEIVAKSGPSSWEVIIKSASTQGMVGPAKLKIESDAADIAIGDRVRVLSACVQMTGDQTRDMLVVAGGKSELFWRYDF